MNQLIPYGRQDVTQEDIDSRVGFYCNTFEGDDNIAAQEFLNNPLNATCVADGLRLTERNYISFNTGFDGDEANSHAPLVIRINVAKDAPSLHNPFDTCCDSIEIIYEDFILKSCRCYGWIF